MQTQKRFRRSLSPATCFYSCVRPAWNSFTSILLTYLMGRVQVAWHGHKIVIGQAPNRCVFDQDRYKWGIKSCRIKSFWVSVIESCRTRINEIYHDSCLTRGSSRIPFSTSEWRRSSSYQIMLRNFEKFILKNLSLCNTFSMLCSLTSHGCKRRDVRDVGRRPWLSSLHACRTKAHVGKEVKN